jgi:hypothetical protein
VFDLHRKVAAANHQQERLAEAQYGDGWQGARTSPYIALRESGFEEPSDLSSFVSAQPPMADSLTASLSSRSTLLSAMPYRWPSSARLSQPRTQQSSTRLSGPATVC